MLFGFLQPPQSPFDPPSPLFNFLSSPLRFLVQHFYHFAISLRPPPFKLQQERTRIRLVCISDTHTHEVSNIPDGDVLIHAGDLANQGTAAEIQAQIDWLSSLPHAHKVIIAGNHDSFFDPRSRLASDATKSISFGDTHYLQHSALTLSFPNRGNRQLNFYGAPQIPQCGGNEFAFQYSMSDDAWSNTIPVETDVLVTHTPPRYHLDLPHGMGCNYLLREVWRVRPQVHVFGHVHAGYGRENTYWDPGQIMYEKICARERVGLLWDLVDFFAWMDTLIFLYHELQAMFMIHIRGKESTGGVMVNAALMYKNTGQLGNAPQIIDL
ncbi:MAG: hypothetical protein Q9190_000249 [Brigantiaea leucoxantha]